MRRAASTATTRWPGSSSSSPARRGPARRPRCGARLRPGASTGSATRPRPPAPARGFDWNLGVQRLTTDNAEPNSRFEQTAFAASLGFQSRAADAGARGGPLRRRRRGDRRAHGLRPPRPRRVVREEGHRGVDLGAPHRGAGGAPLQPRLHPYRPALAEPDRLRLLHARVGGPDRRLPDLRLPQPRRLPEPDVTAVRRVPGRPVSRHAASAECGRGRRVRDRRPRQPGRGAPASRSRTNVGVYVQDRVLLGQRAYLTLGGRVERNEVYGTKAVPRAALALRLREGEDATTLRTSAGMGIKAPSFFESYGESFFAKGNPDLEPEQSRTFDLGLEQRLFGSRLRAVVTALPPGLPRPDRLHRRGLQHLRGDVRQPGPHAGAGDRGRARRPAATLAPLLGQYTYTDTEILESANDFSPVYAVGEPLLRRPRNQASLTARLDFARWGAGARWSTSVSARTATSWAWA